MQTLSTHSIKTLVEKQSKFITHLLPYSRFDETLAELKSEHPKARHFVTAYRFLNHFDQVVEGCSDDGEPKGTSGKPTLAVLQGHDLINVAMITVRYFGGTKLGTGGLVRAYGEAANMAIDAAELVEYHKEFQERLAIAYSNLGKVEHAIERWGLCIDEKHFEAQDVLFTVRGRRGHLDDFLQEVQQLVKRV